MNQGIALPQRERGDTIEKFDPGVQLLNTLPEHVDRELSQCDWGDLQYLVALAETGSLRAAAKQRGVSINTARAHISRLEQWANCELILRDVSGSRLSAKGQELYTSVTSLRTSKLDGGAHVRGLLRPGVLTIACTEGLGTSWLTPKVPDLAKRLAPVSVNMQFDYDLRKDRSFLADIGVTYHPPGDPDLVVAKLATLHMMLFASPDYLREYGNPRSIDDLKTHVFVEQAGPGYNETGLDLLLGADRPLSMTRVKTNSALTQAYAAASGAGIAILPSYTRTLTSLLVPLEVQPPFRVPLMYYYHVSARGSSAVETATMWLRGAFDPELYPWFADRFVHPSDFPNAKVHEARVVSLFDHLIDGVLKNTAPQ